MKFKVCGDNILVKRIDEEETKRGGIVIPEKLKEQPITGEVVLVGPGRRNKDGLIIPVEVNVGDEILYIKFAGVEVTIEGEKYLMIQERDVLCIMEDEQ